MYKYTYNLDIIDPFSTYCRPYQEENVWRVIHATHTSNKKENRGV